MKEEIKLSFKEDKKPNWFQRLFKRDKLRRSRPTLGDFIWSMYWSSKHINAMYNYEYRIVTERGCDFLIKMPSRKFRSLNGINSDHAPNTVFWILEQYELGNLIEKPKEDAKIQS